MPEEREKGVERKEKMGCETNLVEEDLDGCEHEVGDNSEDVGSPEGGILDLYGRRVARKEEERSQFCSSFQTTLLASMENQGDVRSSGNRICV